MLFGRYDYYSKHEKVVKTYFLTIENKSVIEIIDILVILN